MSFGNLLLLLLMWGVSLHVWSDRGINFVRLLQLQQTEFGNAQKLTTHMDVYNTAADLIMIFLVVFIVFNKSLRSGYVGVQYTHLIPLFMTKFFIYRLFVPLKSRELWWNMLSRSAFECLLLKNLNLF